MPRGMLTDKVQKVAKYHLNREFTQEELRLVPYIHHAALNGGLLDYRKLNTGEHELLKKWEDEELLTKDGRTVYVTLKFWRMANQMLWYSYVEKPL